MKRMHNKTKFYLLALSGMLLLTAESPAMMRLLGGVVKKGLQLGQKAGAGIGDAVDWQAAGDFIGKGVRKISEGVSDAAIAIKKRYDDAARAQVEAVERDYREKLAILKEQWQNARDPEERREARADYNRMLTEKQDKIRAINEWAMKAAQGYADTLQGAVGKLANNVDLIKEQLSAKIKTAHDVAIEAERGKWTVEKAKAQLEWFGKNPHIIVGVAAGVFASYFILKHGSQYVADRYRIPTLAQETSLLSPMQKVSNWVFGIKPDSDLKAVKFSPEMSIRMARSARGLKNMVANGSLLLNKLFYGPPGTGKTEYAKRLARDSDMEYVYFSAALVEQFTIEEATKQIKELFDKARKSSKPYMIVADEAEICLADREKMFSGGSTPLNDKRYAIANIFLTELGDGSPHYMVVAITNFEKELDRAFLNRCGEEIEFYPPDVSVRREILDHFLDKNLVRGDHLAQKANVSGWRKFLSFVIPEEKKKVVIAKDALSDKVRAGLSERLNGWVGRDIKNFVLLIEQYARATDTCMITPEIIEEALKDALLKKQKDDERYRQQVAERNARAAAPAA